MRYFAALLILTLAATAPAQAQSNGGPSEATLEILEDVRLSARFEAAASRWTQNIEPIEERASSYVGRPVRSEIAYTVPTYGASVGLGFRGAEVFVTYRTNAGLRPDAALRFSGGGLALPLEPSFVEKEAHAQYLIADWIGVGAQYSDRRMVVEPVLPATVDGKEVTNLSVFGERLERTTFSLYVPMRAELSGGLALLAEVGASVYGRADDHYDTAFEVFQDDPRIPDEGADLESTGIDAEGHSMNAQFAEVGVEYPVLGLPVRATVQVERVSVPDVSDELRGGLGIQVGLPF